MAHALHAWASDHFEVELPTGHPFPILKYRMLRLALVDNGILDDMHIHASDIAPVEWLARVHQLEYVERVLEGGLTGAE